jgi:hypothetical protein
LSRALAIRAGALLALCGAVVAGCGGGGDSSSSSTAAQNLTDCNINGRQQSLGASYVTSIEVAKIGCGQAERLVAAYHRCRLQHGGPGGRCTSAVIGFTCTEGAREGVPKVQYNASVDCRKGGAEVKSTYTQNF